MRREGVDQEECDMAIREHGLAGVDEVMMGVLEPDGSISIVPKDAKGSGVSRRRVRRRYKPGR